MIKNDTVIKNVSWIVGVNIARSLIGLTISMLTARYLGPSNYGLISYASAIVSFVIPIMNLGIPNILVQEFVNNSEMEGEILGTSILLCIVTSILCVVGITSFVAIVNAGEKDTLVVCFLYSLFLIFQATELTQYWFQAKLFAKYSSIVSLVAYILVALYKIFLLLSGSNVYWFAASMAVDYLIVSAGLLIVYKKLRGQHFLFSVKLAKRLFSRSRHFIIPSLMVSIFIQTDRVMLKSIMGSEYAGLYSAALVCSSLTEFVFGAIINSTRPIIFESKKITQNLFEEKITQVYSLIMYLSLGQSIIMTIFAPIIVNILFGSAYAESANVLRLVVWYTTFSYFGPVRNIWMLAEGREKILIFINLIGAIINIILNFLLIPTIGMMGAAIASVLTQFITNVGIGFLFKSIRKNSFLMIKGANPKILIHLVRSYFILRWRI